MFTRSQARANRALAQSRSRSNNAIHFYQNKQLELYAGKEANRLTLRQLVFFGRSMGEERLIKSANYVRTELPVRIAHRIRDLQALPYVVVTQEGVEKVYNLYWEAFNKLRRYPQVNSIAENDEFCVFLRQILSQHASVIPSLSLGLSLSSQYLPPDRLDAFMRRMLVSRISRRVLAEHHLALSDIHAGRSLDTSEPHVGIIFTGLNVKRSIEKCSWLLRIRPQDDDSLTPITAPDDWPDVIVEGHVGAKFSYIREHLEYIIFELLKNSMAAVRRLHREASKPPPILVTIAEGSNDVTIRISDQGGGLSLVENQMKAPSDLFSFSHTRNASRMEVGRLGALRTLSSSPRGMRATVDEQVERWKDTEYEGIVEPHPRIGIGLPMSNIYATYFGGSMELVSLDGWGSDVYVRLPKLGTNLEEIEV